MINILNKNMSYRIKVIFADKLMPRFYLTPDIRSKNPGWDSEKITRKIEALEFYLNGKYKLVLKGMEKYNFFVEATKSLTGKGSVKLQAFYICGKIPGKNITDIWKIDTLRNRITRFRKQYDKEWGGSPVRGWKNGEPNKPISNIEVY